MRSFTEGAFLLASLSSLAESKAMVGTNVGGW